MAYRLPLSLAYHESSQSWRELLGQLKRLGLAAAPKLVIGDGSLGFWIALQEENMSRSLSRCTKLGDCVRLPFKCKSDAIRNGREFTSSGRNLAI